jgi:sarcosine oxidase
VETYRAHGIAIGEADTLPLDAIWSGPAFIDEEGGVLRTRAAIARLAAHARIVHDEVLAVRPDDRGVQLVRGDATERHHRVIVCAGRGTAELARGAGLDIPIMESQHTRLTFRLKGPPPEHLPCLLDGEHGTYGDPLPGNRHYAVGATADYVRRVLPGLDPEPVGARSCWVTELPTGHDHFLIEDAGAARFVAGNNLFKHAPALGRRAAAGPPGRVP